MNVFLILAFVIVSSVSKASLKMYELDAALSIDGRLVSSPHMIVNEGERASIVQISNNQTTFIEVTTFDGGKSAVKMKFVIGKIDSNGHKTVLAKPRIIALEGESAQIEQADDQGHSIKLDVIPLAH